tara:strand:+ start:386 stop:607 length:222 start_codon:yes stop_codon:yes gene_type:complete
MSGLPGLACWPIFEEFLRKNEFSDNQIENLTFNNVANRFELDIKKSKRKFADRRSDYSFDPYKIMATNLKWSV